MDGIQPRRGVHTTSARGCLHGGYSGGGGDGIPARRNSGIRCSLRFKVLLSGHDNAASIVIGASLCRFCA